VNSLRARVLAKEPLLGAFLTEPSATMAEVLAQAGFDFVVLDTEHGIWDAPGVASTIRACDAAAIPAVVRVPGCQSVSEAGRALDAGAAGTLFPRADGFPAVRAAVESVKFAPVGRRGLGGVRANRYAGVPLDHWVLEANEATAIFVQIETAGALNAACEIASEKWVDLLFVGPNDLSQALGVPGHYDDPRYVAGVERVAQVAGEHGKAAGIMLRTADQIPALRQLGYTLFTTSDRSLLAQSAKAWRKALSPGPGSP
jgi:2-keto-3-deoxy-L-rhamnonate aldolase RhmA